MSHKKRKTTHKSHPIDEEHSLKGVKHSDAFSANVSTDGHSVSLSKHLNPHAAFGARTTLSKGRGK